MATGGAIAILVIAYESQDVIENLLDRIPETVHGVSPLILVSDDASSDATAQRAASWAARHDDRRVLVVRQPRNLGYGGNQKAGFRWAIEEGAELVVLLHGDEQYPPERIGELLAPLVDGTHDASFGSRMLVAGGARRGRMPLTRRIGNRSLTLLLNGLTGTSHSEWFSGFRAYRCSVLEAVGLGDLTDGFDFDVELAVRLIAAGHEIAEIAIPTRYGDELSRVPLLRTGLVTILHGLRARGGRR